MPAVKTIRVVKALRMKGRTALQAHWNIQAGQSVLTVKQCNVCITATINVQRHMWILKDMELVDAEKHPVVPLRKNRESSSGQFIRI